MTNKDLHKKIAEIISDFNKNNSNKYASVSTMNDAMTITIKEGDQARDSWMLDQIDKIQGFTDGDYDIIVNDSERKILVALFRDECNEVYPGVAYFSEEEKYDFNLGLAIAFSEAMSEEIPNFIQR